LLSEGGGEGGRGNGRGGETPVLHFNSLSGKVEKEGGKERTGKKESMQTLRLSLTLLFQGGGGGGEDSKGGGKKEKGFWRMLDILLINPREGSWGGGEREGQVLFIQLYVRDNEKEGEGRRGREGDSKRREKRRGRQGLYFYFYPLSLTGNGGKGEEEGKKKVRGF